MKEILNFCQGIITVIGGFLGMILGGRDGFLYALLVFIILDYITGVMVAIIQKKLSSDIGARGIFKKVLILALVAVGHVIDEYIIQSGSVIRTAVIFFYISNEGISILENVTLIGLPVPQKLKDVLEQLNKDDDKT